MMNEFIQIQLMKSDLDQKQFSDKTPYEIMFGPDVCGIYSRKIRAIFHYKNSYYHCNSFLPLIVIISISIFTVIIDFKLVFREILILIFLNNFLADNIVKFWTKPEFEIRILKS